MPEGPATSREALGISGESIDRIPSLSLPAAAAFDAAMQEGRSMSVERAVGRVREILPFDAGAAGVRAGSR